MSAEDGSRGSTLEARLQHLEDLEAIRKVAARYCLLQDARRCEELADLFTPDGEFHGLRHVKGRSELIAYFSELEENGLEAFWHYNTNHDIDIDGDVAHVESAIFSPQVVSGAPWVTAGRYDDHLVRTDLGWRYTLKEIHFDYFAPLEQAWAASSSSLGSEGTVSTISKVLAQVTLTSDNRRRKS
jgi:SnoaL-like domain